MRTPEELREHFGHDLFAVGQGMEIESAGDGRAVCGMALEARHKNAWGAAMGGLVYALADFAFAVAAGSLREGTVTLNGSINYLRPATGARLRAAATPVSAGKTVCVYSVAVEDAEGTQVAQATFTGFVKWT